MTITFVGEVPQGTLNTTVPLGLSIRSSQVPQAGALTSVLGYPAADGDRVFQFDNTTGNYKVNTFLGFLNSWDPQEPNLAVGESFFIQSGVTKTWTRTFSVN